jgi:hypothetical protein
MRQIKILKNTTSNDITVFGHFIPAGASQDVSPNKFLKLIYEPDVHDLVIAGDLVVNNGTEDLSASDGIVHLERLSDPIQFPELVKIYHSFQFQFVEEMDYDQYLVSYVDNDTQKNRLRRSGDPSNGMRYDEAAPIISPCSGVITRATVVTKGIACSTGTPSSSCEYKFELWNVGFQNEGTKITDVVFDVDNSTFPIGRWWNTFDYDTNLIMNIPLSVNVSCGDRLALKFIRQYGNDKIIAARHVTVSFSFLES